MGARRKPNIESTIRDTSTIQIPRITCFDFIIFMITRNIKFGKSRAKLGKRKKRLFESVVVTGVFIGVFVLIVGLFIFQNVKIGQKRGDLEKRAQELQAQVQELSVQRQALEANVEKTQTQEYQEKVLREQGLYKKEGEQVVTVLPPEATVETEPVQEKKERVWWKPWTW